MFEQSSHAADAAGPAEAASGGTEPWRRRALIVSLRDARSLELAPGGREPARDAIDFDGFGYVRHGRGWCECDGSRFELRAGDLLVWRAGRSYRHGASGPAQLSLATATFTVGWCGAQDPPGDAPLPDRLRLRPEQGEALEAELARLAERFVERSTSSQMLASVGLLGLCAQVRRMAEALPSERKHWCSSRRGEVPAALVRARAFIDAHLTRRLSRVGIARVAGVHPAYLGELFQRHLGCAPLAYLRARRIELAKALLAARGREVAAVAREVGFDDPAHFSRVFRRCVGVPPSRFRAAS